jgi:mRNA interferase RelE/StbE
LPYRVEFETRARKEFLELPRQVAQSLIPAFDDLQNNPHPPGAKKLTGVAGYRLRKGDYRVLYTIDHKSRLIRIYRIGHRREIYR